MGRVDGSHTPKVHVFQVDCVDVLVAHALGEAAAKHGVELPSSPADMVQRYSVDQKQRSRREQTHVVTSSHQHILVRPDYALPRTDISARCRERRG